MIDQSETVIIESNDILHFHHFNKQSPGIKISTFLHNLKQPTKKNDIAKYEFFLIVLNI